MNNEQLEDEVEKAMEEERERKATILFPVRVDDSVFDTAKAWAAKLKRQRNVGDFTKWKDHDSYQKALVRLLRDLKQDQKAD